MHCYLLRKTSFTLFLIAICISGYAQESSFEHYQIDINGKRYDFFEFIEHVEIIPLEETEQSLLSRVEAYFPTPNGIGIIDKKNNQLQLFSKTGKYLNTINRFGQGPEEYSNLGSSVWVENSHISLYSSLSQAVLHFDLDGNYLKTASMEYPKEVRGGGLVPYKDGYVLQLLDQSMSTKSSYNLLFLDKQFKELNYAAPNETPHPFPVNLSNRFSQVNNQLVWKKLISESIFVIEDYKAKPFMKFDFGENWIWNDPKTTIDHSSAFNAIWKNEDKVWEVLSKVNEAYAVLTYHYKVDKNDKGLIDRSSGEFYRLDTRKENGENFNLYFLVWENDRLTTSLQAYDVEEFLENLDDDQYNIAGGLKYEDFAFSENPVLLRIKFRIPD